MRNLRDAYKNECHRLAMAILITGICLLVLLVVFASLTLSKNPGWQGSLYGILGILLAIWCGHLWKKASLMLDELRDWVPDEKYRENMAPESQKE